jgi:hypothetical protein
MALEDLINAAKKHEPIIGLCKTEKAESILAKATEQRIKFQNLFPALFEGEDPIKKWVVLEPKDSRTFYAGEYSLAMVLENNTLVYMWCTSSGFVIACGKYIEGVNYRWAKIPTDIYSFTPVKDTNFNELRLVEIIQAASK